MNRLRVYLDSDVIISSVISKKGAAFQIINNFGHKFYISNLSMQECRVVVKRLKIENISLEIQMEQMKKVKLSNTVAKQKYKKYVRDKNDSHVIAGAVKSKARYLLTYNLKHFEENMIKRDFNINVMQPGRFVQFLRSLK